MSAHHENGSYPEPDFPSDKSRFPKQDCHASTAMLSESGIDAHLISRAISACEMTLPSCEVDTELLRQLPTNIDDDELRQHVHNRICSEPEVSAALKDVAMLDKACDGREAQLTRVINRLLRRQQRIPNEIPASKAKYKDEKGKERSRGNWVSQAANFWWCWAGLGFALLITSLVGAIGLELTYEISVLLLSSVEQFQSLGGALGFVGAFTIGVVLLHSFRASVLRCEKPGSLLHIMSRRFHYFAWWGLGGLGLMMGGAHFCSDGFSYVALPWEIGKLLLTALSVLVLGGIGVALEWSATRAYRTALQWTLVENPEIEALEARLVTSETQLEAVQQCRVLKESFHEYVTNHVGAESVPWIAQRDALHMEAAENEAIRTATRSAQEQRAAAERAQRELDALTSNFKVVG